LSLSSDPSSWAFTSVADFADRMGTSRSTAYTVSRTLCHVGVMGLDSDGGLALLAPQRAVLRYAALWKRHPVGVINRRGANVLVEDKYAVWGAAVTVEKMGLDGSENLPLSVYTDFRYCHGGGSDGDVIVYRWPNRRLPAGEYATVAQTLAELFNTPGADHTFQEVYARSVRK